MTTEQEKAIKRLEKRIKDNEDYKIMQVWLTDDVVATQEVLSMLKEKDKLINEQLKENIKLQEELNEENKRCMILANNDKFKEQMSYKRIIIKLQRLYAYYDSIRYEPNVCKPTKEECDLICKEINNLLESEEYAMKKHFKY